MPFASLILCSLGSLKSYLSLLTDIEHALHGAVRLRGLVQRCPKCDPSNSNVSLQRGDKQAQESALEGEPVAEQEVGRVSL